MDSNLTPVLDHPDQDSDSQQPPPFEALIEDELLVEEVSIDGMCGVY